MKNGNPLILGVPDGQSYSPAVARFEKVSFEQFLEDTLQLSDKEGVLPRHKDVIKELYDRIPLPKRGTVDSAGYDFATPFNLAFTGWQDITFPSGIRVNITPGWFLMMAPRSGSGFREYIRLANTIGVIDSGYYHSDNEGHIMVKIRREQFSGGVEYSAGERMCQGILLPFGIAEGDSATAVRNGGFGSTGS